MRRLPRSSGVLLHPTSLPGPHGIGDLGPTAFQFLDALAEAGQNVWQVLPITPTGYGNSPYASPSALAGNPLLIAFEPLLEMGWIAPPDLAGLRSLPADRVDFERLVPARMAALRAAFRGYQEAATVTERARVDAFREAQRDWVEEYALFAALHEEHGTSWQDWPAAERDRASSGLRQARERLAAAAEFHVFCQAVFAEQWARVRSHANQRGIRIVGDIPIFVALDSADVWMNREQFKLNPDGSPTVVAGVPPDYFSEDGQLWGNPLYDWERMALDGHAWWVARFRRMLEQVDVVRVDHFRGFQSAWEVPAGADTAREGAWVEGPGRRLFDDVDRALGLEVPVIAEDLGLITDEVRALLADLGYPGMRVLQFAFGGDDLHPYLPHMLETPNCVMYTGTHDNDTTRGWYLSATEEERDRVRRYVGSNGEDVAWDLVKVALASVADTAIVPMQDLLDLGSEARMNVPGRADGNWAWRMRAEQLNAGWGLRLRGLAQTYGRVGA